MANDTEPKAIPSPAAEPAPQKPPLPLWRKIALAFIIAAMAGVLGLMLTAYLAEQLLCREIYKISKGGEPLKPSDLYPIKNQTQEGEDANEYYFAALGQIRPGDVTNITQVNLFYRTNMSSLPANQFPADLREKVAETLQKTEPILRNFDKGAQLNLSRFDIGVFEGSQVCKSRLDSVQAAAGLLSLRTLDSILAGKSNAAVSSIISTLKLTRVFDSFPTIFVQKWKSSCIAFACGDIQLLLERCNPTDEQLSRLQTLLNDAFPSDSLKKSLMAERVYQLELARNLIPSRITSRYLSADVPDLPERVKMPPFTWHRMRLFFLSEKYLKDMAWLIKVSNQPWPSPLDELTDSKSRSFSISARLLPGVTLLTRLNAETLAGIRCTNEAIAIERYRHQEGRLPETLAETAPKYIESVPLDPFTGKALLYIHDEQTYTVYSAGMNRIDDKGAITGKGDQQMPLDSGVRVKHSTVK